MVDTKDYISNSNTMRGKDFVGKHFMILLHQDRGLHNDHYSFYLVTLFPKLILKKKKSKMNVDRLIHSGELMAMVGPCISTNSERTSNRSCQ